MTSSSLFFSNRFDINILRMLGQKRKRSSNSNQMQKRQRRSSAVPSRKRKGTPRSDRVAKRRRCHSPARPVFQRRPRRRSSLLRARKRRERAIRQKVRRGLPVRRPRAEDLLKQNANIVFGSMADFLDFAKALAPRPKPPFAAKLTRNVLKHCQGMQSPTSGGDTVKPPVLEMAPVQAPPQRQRRYPRPRVTIPRRRLKGLNLEPSKLDFESD